MWLEKHIFNISTKPSLLEPQKLVSTDLCGRLRTVASNQEMGHDEVLEFGPMLARLSSLKKLDLCFNVECAYRGFGEVFCATLAILTSLREIALHTNEPKNTEAVPGIAVINLGSVLAMLTSLESLDLSWNCIDDGGVTTLRPHLAKLTSLNFLDLSGNRIGDSGAKALSTAIVHLSHLKWVILCDNCIGDEGAEALLPALAHHECLALINLCSNKIGDKGMKALGTHASMFPSLHVLRMFNNYIGDVGAQAAGPTLAGIPTLQWIDLSGNKIGHRTQAQLKQMFSGVRDVFL